MEDNLCYTNFYGTETCSKSRKKWKNGDKERIKLKKDIKMKIESFILLKELIRPALRVLLQSFSEKS